MNLRIRTLHDFKIKNNSKCDDSMGALELCQADNPKQC